MRSSAYYFLFSSLVLMVVPTHADNATVAGTATAEARSSNWIAATAPLSGDDNRNGYTQFELGSDPAGPFDISDALYQRVPGPSEWRVDTFWRGAVAASATYFVRVTHVDPDGVTGPNPQVIGPITTPASSPDAVTAGPASAEADDRTLSNGIHGWAQEIEVFNTLPAGDLLVIHTADSGPGSLRQAILDANADPATLDVIAFVIPTDDPGFDGSVFTIQPLSALPAIHHNTAVDGTTQTAFSGDTNPLGPEVVLNGDLVGSGSGLLFSGDGNTARGLVINGFPGTGLVCSRLPFDTTPSNNQLLGNYIGTDPTGTVAVPNGTGISIGGFGSPSVQARNNVVEGNLISGNFGHGISMCDAGDTRIVNNLIGTDRTGTAPLGNEIRGISLVCAGDPRTLIQGNTIAWNGEDGVHDAPDYRFGVAFTADGHQGNAVRGNSIFGNGGLGINLLPPPFPPTEPPSTPTPNDSCDTDAGGNFLQNFPQITDAITDGVGTTTIDGFLDSRPDETFEIEFFANDAGDSSGFGEGQTWLAAVAVTTDSFCLADFSVVLPVAIPEGSVITATATDAAGNTSEFSAVQAVVCTDSDGDGVCDVDDLCPGFDDNVDTDGDGIADGCDLCEGDDATGDADGDRVCDGTDNCPADANADQADLDDDGLGDVCDPDDDGDGIDDGVDNCPADANAGQADLDLDGQGDVCDPDADGDGVDDGIDNCPADANTDQADLDSDGLGDACDLCQVSNGTQATGIGPVASARASVDFLAGLMDAYHGRFPVYDDVSSAGNHFPFIGVIASHAAAVLVNGSWTDSPHTGATAVRCELVDIPGANWGGFYFMNGVLPDGALAPLPNWGTEPDAGIAIPEATALTFWARGENGGELIEFFMGGVGHPDEPFPDSSPKHPASGLDVVLTTEWQQFSIPLAGVDLSYVLGGFGWVTNDSNNPGGAVFYLDDIRYELTASGQAARLDEPRFIQSYETLPLQPDPTDTNTDDDIDFVLRNLAFTYDNALALLAFLADGSVDGLHRARLLGDAFVYASLNDRFFDDGRMRTAYAAGDLALPPGWTPNGRIGTAAIPGFFDEASGEFFEVEQGDVDVGNNSWAMTALLALFDRTGEISYLDAARRIGDFIRTCRNDSGTFQGFQGGIDDPEVAPTRNVWASGEHNLDVYAAFSLMAELTGETSWLADATHAQTFVETLWDPGLGCYFAGTIDPETRNEIYDQVPLDIQAWSVLSLPDVLTLHPVVLGCIESNHRTAHGGFAGYDFNTDQDGVWFEGTAQAAVAYLEAGRPDLAAPVQEELRCAQATPPFGDGSGLFAATRDGLTTGFDFKYFQRFHIATASWNVFAQLGFNPYYQLPATDLSISKTDGLSEAVPGETVTYTITVSNAGPSAAVGASVVDVFPVALTGISWTCAASGGACGNAAGSGNINETVSLPVGTSVTFTATGTLDPGATGTLDNTVTVVPPAGATDPSPVNNSATDSDILSPQADLRITKSNGSDEAVAGQGITYLIVVTNAGPSDVVGATVTDAFPATISSVNWTCDETGGGTCAWPSGSGDISENVTLPAGASVSFTATGTVDPSATDLSNTATVAAPASTPDPAPANNSATDSDVVTPLLFGDGFESGDTSAWSAEGTSASGSGDISETGTLPAGASVSFTTFTTSGS